MAGNIKVRFYALLRRRLQREELEVEGDGLAVLDVLQRAEKEAGRSFLEELLDRRQGLLAGTLILVNGENVRLKQDLETRVRGGDTVELFSPAGGG